MSKVGVLGVSMYLFKFFIFCSLVVCCHANETKTLDVDGIKRLYRLHLPKEGDKETPVPLVLMLHGAGGTALLTEEHYGWDAKADQEHFIVAYPQALPKDLSEPYNFRQNPTIWEDGSGRRSVKVADIEFLAGVIEDISKEHKVDPKKIFMTGFSNGASMTFRAGIELSDRLTAIAPVAGRLFLKNPQPKRPISLYFMVCDSDPLNPLNGGAGLNVWSRTKTYKPPMFDSMKAWIQLISADVASSQEIQLKGGKETIYRSKNNNLEAIYVIAKEQGHVWPGSKRELPEKLVGPDLSALNATDLIWNFFKTKASI